MKRFLYISIILISGLLNSCTKEIDIELEEGERRLVVDCWFTTDTTEHVVKLTQTSNYFSQEAAPKVSGASVQIIGGGDVWDFTEVEPGLFKSSVMAHAKMGNEYTLSIDYEGQNYTATDFCDTVPNLDNLDLYYNDHPENPWYDLLIWTTELSGYGHWYCWRTLVNGEYVRDTLSEISFDSDEYLGNGLTFEAFPIEWIYADLVVPGDTITLEQHNISKQTYDAFEAILTETEWKGGIFDSPPANIESNISNNGLGVFLVSSVHTRSVIVP